MPGTILAPKLQLSDATGVPLSGGKIHTYDAGTTDNKTTYSDADLSVAQTNPVILNSRGEPTDAIWFAGTMKIVVTDSADVEIYTVDNIIGVGGSNGQVVANQAAVAGAIPAINITQADVSEEIMEITSVAGVGNAIEAVGGKTLTTTTFIKATINGSTVYIPAGTIA